MNRLNKEFRKIIKDFTEKEIVPKYDRMIKCKLGMHELWFDGYECKMKCHYCGYVEKI